jgi:UDP-glucose 4-epimerase
MDVVVHMAAINGTRHFYERPREVLDVGIRGTLNVIDACRTYGVKTLVLLSSSEVYQTPPIVPTPEEVPLVVPDVFNPRYSYGGSKIASELLAIHSGIPRVVIVRPHNVYGPDMGWEHVIPEFAVRLLKRSVVASIGGRLAFPMKGDGSQRRAFIHMDDFTEGLMRVIDQPPVVPIDIYNIGDPYVVVSIAQLAYMMAAILHQDIDVTYDEAPAGETRERCPSISKLRALGFEPKVTLRDGLVQTIAWYNQHLSEAP